MVAVAWLPAYWHSRLQAGARPEQCQPHDTRARLSLVPQHYQYRDTTAQPGTALNRKYHNTGLQLYIWLLSPPEERGRDTDTSIEKVMTL